MLFCYRSMKLYSSMVCVKRTADDCRKTKKEPRCVRKKTFYMDESPQTRRRNDF